MSEASDYIRQNLVLDGQQVTVENIVEVSLWCKGDLGTAYDGVDLNLTEFSSVPVGKVYIQVDPANLISSHANRAFIGDWVLSNGISFIRCSDQEYQSAIVIKNREKYRAVLNLVRKAIFEYHDAVANMHGDVIVQDLELIIESVASQIVALD